MILLAVESSCDETAVALVQDGRTVLADCIASSVEMHKIYGGVVPEIASRKHIEVISQLADQALVKAGLTRKDIDAVAVTYAPGLIGAVLVGVSFAKSVAYALGVPLIPVHHVRGHIAANYIAHPDLEPPFVCLCVSGGTSLIVDVRGYTDVQILGATRDDAAGECFDKIARVMGLGYPGGAPLDRAAQTGNDQAFQLPRVHIQDAPLDMSFSGLKTAMLNLIHNTQQKGEDLPVSDLAASFSAAVSDELVPRTMAAARDTGCIVTSEEANIVGGLGSAVSEYLTSVCPVPVIRHGVEDEFGRSGAAQKVLEAYHLTPAGIADKVRQALTLKQALTL